MKYKSLTIKSESGKFADIVSEIGVSGPVENREDGIPLQRTYWTTCLWDTGATHSAITQETVALLGLKPTGEAKIVYGSGETTTKFYTVSLMLPDLIFIPELSVTESAVSEGFGVIIGMDIICQGDFAITNVGGNSTFSFCAPSLETIDFADRIKKLANKG